MDPEQTDEFIAGRESAFEALRLGTCIGRQRSLAVCQLLILPSFENPVSWDVTEVVSRQETRLHRSCWRMDVDSQALRSPVERAKHPRPFRPTLETGWVLVNAGKLDAILSPLREIRIPLM